MRIANWICRTLQVETQCSLPVFPRHISDRRVRVGHVSDDVIAIPRFRKSPFQEGEAFRNL